MRQALKTATNTPDRKLKYVAYFRKSTESDERQVQSIPDQKAWAEGIIGENNLHIAERLDESMSARKTGRPIFNEVISYIEEGRADALIAYDPSRLARNAIDGAKIIELIDTGKLRHLVFATYAFENTSIGKFMLGFFFAQSKLYTDSLSEVIVRGMKSRASKGVYPSKAKIGYFNHPRTKEIIPDPKQFPLIRKAFKLYASNRYSLVDLSKELFKLGLTTRSGRPLSNHGIEDILTDPFYYGAFVWSGELYQGIHKRAVSKKLWDDVQKVRISRSRPHSKFHYEKIFCGLLHCPECGGAITADRKTRTQKNGNKHVWVYYRCTKKKGVPCSQKYIREEELVEQLRQGALSIALPDDMAIPMLDQIEKWKVEEESRASEQSPVLRAEAKEIEAKLRRLNDLAVDGEIDRQEYLSRKGKLVNEKIAVESRMKLIAHEGALYWLEPLREFVNSLWERNMREAGDDLLKLRDFFAEGGSNLRLESRKVLWDWLKPHALLAERGLNSDWWS
jgi:site-specific DNA recombinase